MLLYRPWNEPACNRNLVNTDSDDQSAAFIMSRVALDAAEAAALLTKWALKMPVSTPALSRMFFRHLAGVEEAMDLWAFAWLSKPEWGGSPFRSLRARAMLYPKHTLMVYGKRTESFQRQRDAEQT